MGVMIQGSANILFKNNIIFGHVRYGLNINTANNITVDGNVVVHILQRSVNILDATIEVGGGLISCALINPDSCSDVSVINNIVAGVNYTGFAAYGHECNKYTSKNFKNNTAHSVAGTGAVIFPDPNSVEQRTCMEGSYFYAYKNKEDGAVSFFNYKEVQYSNMIFIDNAFGPTVMVG